jgi:hypothetical protein
MKEERLLLNSTLVSTLELKKKIGGIKVYSSLVDSSEQLEHFIFNSGEEILKVFDINRCFLYFLVLLRCSTLWK